MLPNVGCEGLEQKFPHKPNLDSIDLELQPNPDNSKIFTTNDLLQVVKDQSGLPHLKQVTLEHIFILFFLVLS